MNSPDIKIISVSNVYSRLMHFHSKGDVENGHTHNFDHGTLISSGSVLYEVLDSENGKTLTSKVVEAPNFIFVDKNKYHRITALEDNTVCACIHALRTNDEELLDPDFLIDPLVGDGKGIVPKTIFNKTGKEWQAPAAKANKYSIRFNKTRGQPGRGTMDHVWRVFENGKEYLFKNLDISVPIKSEKDENGQDYNICCQGYLSIDRETSTAVITAKQTVKKPETVEN